MNEDDFEVLRQKRRLQLQQKMRQEQDWVQLGHGRFVCSFLCFLFLSFHSPLTTSSMNRYLEVNDTKEFFNVAKKSTRVIVHFYRPTTPRCEIVDAHFQKLCQTHLETRFIKINVEKNPFLVERLGILLIPTITLIKDGKTEHSILGFDEFGGVDNFKTEDMAYVLSRYDVLNYDGDRGEGIESNVRRGGVNSMSISCIKRSDLNDDDDDFTLDDDN